MKKSFMYHRTYSVVPYLFTLIYFLIIPSIENKRQRQTLERLEKLLKIELFDRQRVSYGLLRKKKEFKPKRAILFHTNLHYFLVTVALNIHLKIIIHQNY